MDIHAFICKNNVDFAAHLISKADLELAENDLENKFGPQLSEYLLDYGYLGFESVEFYGMNSRQGLKSDIITQTHSLHQYYPATGPYVAFENYGEGDYMLVDSEDHIFRFISEESKVIKTDWQLFDYILARFQAELT